jgi:hypothetical protein
MRNDLTPLDTALALLARGLWPVPIKPRSKAPIGENWGAERPTEESLRTTYAENPGAGVGIRLGPEAGAIDIEVDGAEGEKSLRKLLCGEPLTLGWSSCRGPHYLFRYDPELARYSKGIIKVPELPGLEIRIGGVGKQLQSNCPPTVGDDGKSRQWNDCDEIAELPPSVFVFLDAYMSQPAEPAPAPPAPAPHGSFPAAAGTTLSVEGRAIRYLASVEPAISGQDGSGKTFGAACRVGPGFDLDPETAFRLLRDHYSPRCVPPWSEKELRHKVKDAYENEPRRGWLKDAPLPGASSGSPSGDPAAASRAPSDLESLDEADLGLTRAADIRPAPIRWLWPYRLARSSMAMAAGDGGIGKSLVLLWVGATVSRGDEWPDGSGRAPIGDVIILSAEDRVLPHF